MERIDSIYLSPLYIKSLGTRLDALMSLKDHIHKTMETFNNYSNIGKTLCSCIEKISESFKYEEFKFDPTFQNISTLLDSFSQTLFDHYNQVKTNIIDPLGEFVNNDIKKAEEAGKSSSTSLESYEKSLENFVSFKKKFKGIKENSNLEIENLESTLIREHSKLVDDVFTFDRLMELAERKRLIEISSKFLAFLSNLSVSFRQCTFDYDNAMPEFNILRSSFPQTLKDIDDLQNNMESDRSILHQQQQLFWTIHKSNFQSTGEMNHEGYLWEKTTGFKTTWKKKYVICQDGNLSIYNENESENNNNKVNLLLVSPKQETIPDRRFTFSLIFNDQSKITFQAMTQYDMEMWIDVIKNNINHLIGQTHLSPSARQSVYFGGNQNEAAKISQKSVYEKEENKICADCGMMVSSWCCINWGTFICIKCSGVHRSLSSSVSKVRGLTLDCLDSSTVRLLDALGNAKANAILEETIGEKGSELELRMDMQTFIRQKYQECKFVSDAKMTVQNDMRNAIKKKDILSVFKCICYIKKHRMSFFVDINREGNKSVGYTWLHLAASVGDPLVTLLIALNIDNVDMLDEGGWAPLCYAVYYGRVSAVKVLLNCGSDRIFSRVGHPHNAANEIEHQKLAMLLGEDHFVQNDPQANDIKPPVELPEDMLDLC